VRFKAFMVIAKKRATALLIDDLAVGKVGTAEHPSGKVLVVYESAEGPPGSDVAKALRDIADAIDKRTVPAHDITPIIPEASA
jgi:hypothetical protein